MSTIPAPARTQAPVRGSAAALARWWPLAALTLLAAVLRLSTLGLQSFWYDEAFTPVHVLHTSLAATMRAMVHTENTPPLWYVIAWADVRVLGDGEIALRLPSALAGVATVPVAWAIGSELAGRRAAILTAALVAVNPLFVWYSQEARAYSLFVFTVALAMLCFLRAERDPTPGRLAAFALTGVLALLTHYFSLFLLLPMVVWLALAARRHPGSRPAALASVGALAAVGLALIPLVSAQGGHGTQWIGRWALGSRLEAIPQYYLTGASGSPLGHGVELLVALPILAGLALWSWRTLERPAAARDAAPAEHPPPPRTERRALVLTLGIAAAGIGIPLLLAAVGADYLAPRNLVAAMIPLTALIAVVLSSPLSGRAGPVLGALAALGFLIVALDVNVSPRLQRGNWRGVARTLRHGAPDRVITTVQLGSAPLEYYLPGLRNLARGRVATVSEIDETGYSPLRASAGTPPAPGFRLLTRHNIDGLIVYRFVSALPAAVTEATLRRQVITLAHPEVLAPAAVRATSRRPQSSSPSKKI